MVLPTEMGGNSQRRPISTPNFRDWQKRNRVFESLAMFRPCSLNLVGNGGEPERVNGLMVSVDFLHALAVEPVLGRRFLPEDDRPGAVPTVILSHELWQERFSGDSGILGQSLHFDRQLFFVIGVLPAGLSEEPLGWSTLGELWLPIEVFMDRLPAEDRAASPSLLALGRLAPDSTMTAAREDLRRTSQELAEEHPVTDKGYRQVGVPIREEVVRGVRPMMLILLAAVGFILLIACTNLLHLVLTRATRRHQELAARSALGASRMRLIPANC